VGARSGRRRAGALHRWQPKNAEKARRYFERAGVASRITVHTGDAIEILSEQKEQFDIVFNDIDKQDYPRVLKVVGRRVRKGGLFITDNTLWSGKAAAPAALRQSHTGHSGVQPATLCIGRFLSGGVAPEDGVTIALKA